MSNGITTVKAAESGREGEKAVVVGRATGGSCSLEKSFVMKLSGRAKSLLQALLAFSLTKALALTWVKPAQELKVHLVLDLKDTFSYLLSVLPISF